MATIVDEHFESGLGAYSTGGTAPTTGAAAAHAGSNGLIVNTTAAVSSQIFRAIAQQTHTFQFYFRFVQDTSGSASIYQSDCASGTFVIQARLGRKLRTYIGGVTSADSAALNLNQWYRIDGRFVSGASATADLQIDGVALTQLTRVQPAANQTIVRVGNTATNTYIIHVDDWKITDAPGDYPLAGGGSVVSALAGASTGVGALAGGDASTKVYPSRALGTGVTFVGYTGELVVAAALGIGQGFFIANDVQNLITPDATQALGSGAALNPGRTSKPSAGSAAGTGVANNASKSTKVAIEYASATGAAFNASTTKIMSVAAGAAAGTGAAANTTISSTQASLPGLTIHMTFGEVQPYPPDTTLTYVAAPSLSVPAYLVPFVDPTWGTNVMRIYNTANVVHTYSKRQAFNPSETRILLGYGGGSNRALISAVDYSVINAAVGGDGHWWDDTHLLRGNSSTGAIFLYDPETNTNTGTIRSFATYASGSQFNNMTQSSPSDDLRYTLWTGVTAGGQKTVICWDSVMDTFTTLNVTTMPHSGSMSHSGDYLHLNWDTDGTGTEQGMWILDRDFTRLFQPEDHKFHADFQWDTSGNEVFARVPSGSDDGGFYWRCSNGTRTALLPTPNAFRHGHISGRNSNRPGWMYMGTYANDTGTQKGTDQVIAVKLDGSQTVEVFAHSHENLTSDIVGDATAVPNRAGTKVLFHSAWQVLNTSYEYIASMGSL